MGFHQLARYFKKCKISFKGGDFMYLAIIIACVVIFIFSDTINTKIEDFFKNKKGK
jgi:hypothetical protein